MIKFFSVIITLSITIFPQDFSGKSNLTETAENIYTGVMESVSWLDIPVFSMMLLKKNLHIKSESKYIVVSPFSFDNEVQEDIGVNGSNSPGSMDQNTFPNLIFLSRVGYSVAHNFIEPSAVDQNDFKHSFIFYKTLVYTDVVTELSKNLIHRNRPDGSDSRSFFSGHTSTSFAAASFLYLELNDFFNEWDATRRDNVLRTSFKVASASVLYGWAGYVGYSRMRDNKHYLSDVLLGAAVGTAISHLLYHFYFQENQETFLNNFSLGIINKSPSLLLNIQF